MSKYNKVIALLISLFLLSSCNYSGEQILQVDISSSVNEDINEISTVNESITTIISNSEIPIKVSDIDLADDIADKNTTGFSAIDFLGKTLGEIEIIADVSLSNMGMYGPYSLYKHEAYMQSFPYKLLTYAPSSSSMIEESLVDSKYDVVIGVEVFDNGWLDKNVNANMNYEQIKSVADYVSKPLYNQMDETAYVSFEIGEYSAVADWDYGCTDINTVAPWRILIIDYNKYDEYMSMESEDTTYIDDSVSIPDDIWEVMPYIDETPLDYLSYYYRDDIEGIIVDAVIKKGITKIRIPSYIDGIPVVSIDLYSSEVKELVIPDTVLSVRINKEIIEYINYPPFSVFEDTRTRFKEKVLKGVYISENRKLFISEYFGRCKNAVFGYKGNKYDYENVWRIFADEPLLALNIDGTKVKEINATVHEIEIPDGITELCHVPMEVERIILPNSINILSSFAYSNIVEITIPDNVTKLEEGCFMSCHLLEKVVVGNGITKLPKEMFYECGKISEIFLPDGIEYISDGLMCLGSEGCKGLSGDEKIIVHFRDNEYVVPYFSDGINDGYSEVSIRKVLEKSSGVSFNHY